MSVSPPAPAAARAVDAAALAHQRRRLARRGELPWLHAEVARRMADRLAAIRLQPTSWLEWGATLGGGQDALRAAYPRAQRQVCEPLADLLDRHRRSWWQISRWTEGEPAAWLPDQVPPQGAQLLWANMTLQAEADPEATFAAWHRATAVDGFLMFSTFGPDTLRELDALYVRSGRGPAHAPFVDMHDLGDMLVHAGFADPVMDQETITLTWSSPQAVLAELRGLGGNDAPGRWAGLRTPRWRAALEADLAAMAGADGRIALSFEIVYGHAFRPAPRLTVQAETRIGVEVLRGELGRRSGKR